MLKAAIAHKGTVMLDVVSPCVTFNDHEGSTKMYKVRCKEHEEELNEVGFVPAFEEINVSMIRGLRFRSRCTMGRACGCGNWSRLRSDESDTAVGR